MSSPVRPNVQGLRPYVPGKPIEEVRRELGLERIVKLASNENPWGPSPLAIEAVKKAAEQMHYYPDGASFELKQAISEFYGVPVERIVAGNGSEDLIALLGATLLEGPEDEVIMAHPSFARYETAALMAPAKLIKVPVDDQQRHDLAAMAREFTPRTKLVFVANPNNPTGTVVNNRELESFMNDLPEGTTLVLDEAYHQFAEGFTSEYVSSQAYLDRDNVCGLRTLSKAYGIAGIRVGFGFFPEWLVAGLERTRAPFNVSSLAQAAGIAALKDAEHLQRTLMGTRKAIARLTEIFERLGAKVVPSFANFVWADLGRPARPVYDALLAKGVIVRPGDFLGNPNALRVSVGTEEELDVFEEAIVSILQEAAVR